MKRTPRPEVNVDITDRGRFVARVDMLFREERLVVEYQGDYHRDPEQWRRDEMRRAELESLGYRVTYVTAADLRDPEQLVPHLLLELGPVGGEREVELLEVTVEVRRQLAHRLLQQRVVVVARAERPTVRRRPERRD